ncbi:alpha-N-arabinofuranosidase [Egibacter rhizosphaerae]|uniref:non-reducing end alpha-L-arabinofuranosidase n=1 Tax=Egibacter rhizosphaerae TaxID=1670831 RepID=A0A411YAZ5_9ACTN|nr:alpha-N-arabinofuranosidase [Egibacter rhizosphaerae]QBI18352.1 alpha-N-arabinofuranosidase [Egibacter rhizosphaerae]
MMKAQLSLDPAFVVADVRRRTFGSFVEHMGRCVYTGIFEPRHETADEDGHRRDVLDLAREMGVTMVRYPGGNFVSGYRWEDGIGPVMHRPRRLDAAWHSAETNEHGIGEFILWTRKAGVEPNYAINLGTRGVQEALDLLEYANHPGGTYWSDLRIAHGHAEPFGIKMWCLGNEMDGPWQTGHKTPYEYGRLAAETARAMRQRQSGLELVACGSSNSSMPTFGTWEATVLQECYDQVDFISAHAYYNERAAGDLASFLASAVDMESFIEDVASTADHIGAKLRSRKRINISFDEWNVWDNAATGTPTVDWPSAPRVGEDTYTLADAVVVGSLLITLLRHSDRVTAACQAQLVNALAPLRSEAQGMAWRQASFWPFAHASRLAKGKVLDTHVVGPNYPNERFGDTPVIHSVVTHDEESSELVVFVVNRHLEEPVELSVGLRAFPGYRVVEHVILDDEDVHAMNTEQEPDRVQPRRAESSQVDGEDAQVLLPPVSWSFVRLRPNG